MISPAICWASAALPPLPISRILLPARSAAIITAAILRALASSAASPFARSRAASDSFRWAPIGSLDGWLKKHRQFLQAAYLVMIASRLRKRAMSGRSAGSGLGQYVLGDSNHFSGVNVAHAAVVVHGADRTVAGLGRHHGFGLHGCGEAVEGRPVIGAGGTENAHGRRADRSGDMHQP